MLSNQAAYSLSPSAKLITFRLYKQGKLENVQCCVAVGLAALGPVDEPHPEAIIEQSWLLDHEPLQFGHISVTCHAGCVAGCFQYVKKRGSLSLDTI